MNVKQKLRVSLIILVLIGTVFVIYQLPMTMGLDIQGGTRIILEAQDTAAVKADNDAVLGALAVIRNRVDGLGVAEPSISRKGTKQIVLELPGIKEPGRATGIIGETALLEFVEAEWAPGDISSLTPEQLKILAGPNARVDKVLEYDRSGKISGEKPIILKDKTITGAYLKNASPAINSYGEPIVNIEFTAEGAKLFREMTTRSVGKPIAILLDKQIISAPNVNEAISGGRAQISGRFTVAEMRDLVIKLKAGALPVPIKIVSTKIVGPTLGKDSVEKSKKAGVIGFIFILVFMTALYQLPGLMASVALVAYVGMVLALLKIFHATLTLPGIAGLILTMGIAVDANVLIFSRIREERKAGLPSEAALEKGFARAFIAIVDSNVTTLIGALVLFAMGSGPIRGFAVSLGIGILVSMFTAITLTRMLLEGLSAIFPDKKGIIFKA